MKAGKIVRTSVGGVLIALTLAIAVVANIMLPRYDSVISGYLNGVGGVTIKQPDTYTEELDLDYNKADYTAEEMAEIERSLDEEIMGEGAVLLKNEDNLMPFSQDTTFSFFGRSSVNLVSNNWYNPMPKNTLKIAFEDRGFGVNETLWNFYSSGNGSSYGLGGGSLGFGDDEDFSINECPLSVLKSETGLLESTQGTVPVFVWARKVGEGRDLPRSMYNHADNPEDQAKSYLEPDSTELELLTYLNENFDNVVLLINSAAGLELGWVDQFENIRSIIYVPPTGDYGLFGLADIFSGAVNPSGHTVDTFASDVMASPAIQNYGDYQYMDENGQMTKYNYITYKEGIYVGYRYYETRYEDVVMGTGNAGDYDYADQVVYPFGYGLSYTTFQWDNFAASWEGDTCTVTVDVTNTGSVAGKDVVQVYVQSPYTDYDKANNVEKSAVQLVGFGKTEELQPGQTGTVTVTFDKEQLKSYDYTTAKTYILDAGDYYITAAANAHAAVNNVLAAKGYTTTDGMTAEGDASFTDIYTVARMDVDTYSVDSTTGVAITNQFDFADSGCTYLTRSDWQGTWPTHDGEVSSQISTWGNEINGSDGVSYTYVKTISDEGLAKLDSFDSQNPTDPATITDTPVYGAGNDLNLIELRGKDYDDPLWEKLLDNLTPEEYQQIITQSGYGNGEIESIGKPFALDQDAVSGLAGGGTKMYYCSPIVMAQTWNQPLAERYGEMIGNEALMGGCTGWYAPAMNIHRTPFSGRNNEYYSEDPVLSGVMAASTSRGAASKGVYTFIKHFAVNDQENHRGDREGQFSMATWLNEQSIREIYLLPFEMCVKNEPVTLNYVEEDGNGGYVNASRDYPAVTALMTSFNRLGYTWAGGSYNLLTNVLRGEWGFHGFVITDNANTGVFMDAYQMLEAGGDAKLTNEPTGARWTFDKDNPAQYHYARQALHNILYTVANSKLMNGLMPGSEYVNLLSIAQKILISIDIAAAVIILALAYFIFRGFKPTRKKAAKLAAKAEAKAGNTGEKK